MLSRRTFFGISAGALLALQEQKSELTASVNPYLDHIILGCRDLDEGVAYMEKLSGYRAAFGGSHPGRGTRNALLKISQSAYLELLAPDPEQNSLQWHKEIAELSEPMLVGWAMKAAKLDDMAATFRNRGIEVIGPVQGSRTTPNGDVLRWTTLSRVDDVHGILPFYITWDPACKHPSKDAPGGCLVLNFRHTGQLVEEFPPKPGYKIVGMPDTHLPPVQLRATIAGQFGEFVLTSHSVPSRVWVPENAPPH
jgi:hypothetical protein